MTNKSVKKSSAYYQRQYRERLRSQGLVKKEVWILPDFAKTLTAIENLLREQKTADVVEKNVLQQAYLQDSVLQENSVALQTTTTTTTKAVLSVPLTAKQSDTLVTVDDTVEAIADDSSYDSSESSQIARRAWQPSQSWTTSQLFNELLQLSGESHVIFELLPESDNSAIIHITMTEFGDLPLFMTVQGEQIIVETILCLADEIEDVNEFNQIVLKTHKYFPLSTMSLDTLVMESGEGCDVYQMFGSLHATSSINDIMLEIYMLTTNVMQALEAYGDCFKTTA